MNRPSPHPLLCLFCFWGYSKVIRIVVVVVVLLVKILETVSLILILPVKCFWRLEKLGRSVPLMVSSQSVYTVACFGRVGPGELAHKVNLLFKFVIRTHSAISVLIDVKHQRAQSL
jgi:hypothetical protein